MLEKIIFNNLYSDLNANNLITKNQSGFRPGDSPTNQLLFLVDEIHQAFEDTKSLEVRAVFLDISKAFDKVWHGGLIFKLKQNGISGSLLKFFENYLHNRKQRHIKDKLPRKHRYFLYNVFRKVKCKTNRYMNSFFPRAISSWNIVISYFEVLPSFDSLKDYVSSFFRPKPKSIFGVHGPVGLRYLFQLRVGLSPLRSHKSHHNFIDTPSAICQCNQGAEDTNHFLFFCPLYIPQRATLKASVNEILLQYNLNHLENHLQLYLYGHVSINYDGNRKIIISTIKYLKDTRRFST